MAVGTSSALPKATELVSDMGLGYNIGNTMEVLNDPLYVETQFLQKF